MDTKVHLHTHTHTHTQSCVRGLIPFLCLGMGFCVYLCVHCSVNSPPSGIPLCTDVVLLSGSCWHCSFAGSFIRRKLVPPPPPPSHTHTQTHTEEAQLDWNNPQNLELFRLAQDWRVESYHCPCFSYSNKPPYISFFNIHVLMKEISVGGLYT